MSKKPEKLDIILRLIRQVDNKVNIKGCWIWKGNLYSEGYGQTSLFKKKWRVHRLIYTLFVAEIPAGLYVCHTCDNPSCVRPKHLFLGTQKENLEDMVRKGRSSYGTKRPACKLTEDIVKQIRGEYRPGLGYILAEKYGISHKHFMRIINREQWKHI